MSKINFFTLHTGPSGQQIYRLPDIPVAYMFWLDRRTICLSVFSDGQYHQYAGNASDDCICSIGSEFQGSMDFPDEFDYLFNSEPLGTAEFSHYCEEELTRDRFHELFGSVLDKVQDSLILQSDKTVYHYGNVMVWQAGNEVYFIKSPHVKACYLLKKGAILKIDTWNNPALNSETVSPDSSDAVTIFDTVREAVKPDNRIDMSQKEFNEAFFVAERYLNEKLSKEGQLFADGSINLELIQKLLDAPLYSVNSENSELYVADVEGVTLVIAPCRAFVFKGEDILEFQTGQAILNGEKITVLPLVLAGIKAIIDAKRPDIQLLATNNQPDFEYQPIIETFKKILKGDCYV